MGNRTAYTETTPLAGTAVTTYTYDAANRLLVSASPGHRVTYTWDARGNLTGDGTFTYAYNAAGKMVRAQSLTTTLVYTYNGDGLRVGQAVGGAETTFAWDLAAGLAVVISDTAAVYLHTPDGALLAEQRDGQWAYPLAESLGSVRQWSSDAGHIVGYVEYDPFGIQRRVIGVLNSPYGYTGEYQEMALGLIYLRARYYAPVTGRFLQVDPWPGDYERPQSLNRFVYVENNPANFADPSGLCTACRRGSVVTVGGTGGIGLAARVAPSLHAWILTRLPDGTRVVLAEDQPVWGSGLKWRSTYLPQVAPFHGRVWLADKYLLDDPRPMPPASPGPSSDWVLPLDEPINYTSGYGYYDWATTNGKGEWSCRPEQRKLPYEGCQAGFLCLHNGWDMTSGTSNNVYAMGDGVIFEEVHDNEGVPYLLKVLHNVNGQDVEVQYTHIQPAAGLTPNSTVQAGQKIGEYGAFGYDIDWPHLHLSFKRGKYGPLVDPALYWPAGQTPASFSYGSPILPGP